MVYAPDWQWIPGDPHGVCDQCGFKYRRSQLFKRWDGCMVCQKDLDPRPPEMNPPRVWPEGIPIQDPRPEPPNVFIEVDVPPFYEHSEE